MVIYSFIHLNAFSIVETDAADSFCVWRSSFQKSCCENYFICAILSKLISLLKCTITSQKAVWLKFGDLFFYTLKCFQTARNDAADSSACEVVVFRKVVVKITFLWNFIETHFTIKMYNNKSKSSLIKIRWFIFLYIKVLY